MGLRNFNFLTRLESSWFNWQRLVISKSNRVPPLPARYLLISQLWLSCRGSRDYKPTIISLPIKSLYPNPMPNLCSVSLEILTFDKNLKISKKNVTILKILHLFCLKLFCSAVLEMTPKLASPHLLMRLLVDYAAVLSVLHHREPEGARVLCDTWSLQKISHQELVLLSEKRPFVDIFSTWP